MYISYIYDSQIVHHNPCFNLFILHNNSFVYIHSYTSLYVDWRSQRKR